MDSINIKDFCFQLKFSLLILTIPLFSGCATSPKDELGSIFYPPLPNPPHIQYLHTFSNEYDIGDGGGSLGKFVLGADDELSPIIKPYGTAIYDGKIYVVDVRGNGYAIFDLKNQELRFVMGSGNGFLNRPINIEIDENGNKYVTDTLREQVIEFDANDEFVRAYGEKGQFKPSDVAVDGNRLYVSDLSNHTIHVLDKVTGKTISRIASEGSGDDQVFMPTNIDIVDEKLYISDTYNGRVQVFTLNGEHVSTVGRLGTAVGEFARPKGVAADKEKRLYVVDAAFQNVQIFNEEGKLLLFFGGPGKDRDSMNLPSTVVIDYDNVEYFKRYADPKFHIEYVVLVTSQYGSNKVNAYGFGRMEGFEFPPISAK